MKLREIPNANEVSYSHFQEIPLAFDGYIALYQFLTGIQRDGDYIRNTEGRCISHLLGIMNRFGSLLEAGVKPIVVLDGGYPDLKTELVAERSSQTEEAREAYLNAKERGDVEEMKQYSRQRTTVTDFMLDSAQEALDAMGIPVVQAPSEGEPQCAQLVREGKAAYPVSEDYDTVLYHPSMVRSFGRGSAEVLDFVTPLDEMGWEHDHLIWHSIVLGTDYNESPSGVGPVGAKQIVDEADNFGQVVALAQARDESINTERWWETYEWVKDPNVTEDATVEHGTFDPEAFRSVMIDEYSLLESQVESKIESITETQTVEADG